jgi:hypothetical protein
MPDFSPEMIAEAKANPGGHVYQIDWAYGDHEAVPREAIVGAWKVGLDGVLTGEFSENPNYRPVKIAERSPQEYMFTALAGGGFKNQWMLEIDPDHLDSWPDVPEEWQVGVWYVGDDGRYTGQFRSNAKYAGSLKT